MPTAAELKAMISKVKPVKEVKESQKEPIAMKVRKKAAKPIKTSEDLQGAIEILTKQVTSTRTNRKDFAGNGHWSFDQLMGQRGKFGFIYVIRDLRNGKAYIGKKQYRGAGTENYGQESNWPWYISSRDSLVEQIKVHGRDQFEFIVLEEYESNKALGYAEVWSLMHAETPANQDKWYNRLVPKVSWFCKEQISARHKARLDAIINNEPILLTVNL